MLQKKINLNDRIRKMISDYRKSAMKQNPLLTADYISEQIGRAKSWLSQVENGRLKSVKTQDLINAFCYIESRDINSKKDRKIVEKFLDDQIMYIQITEKHGIYDSDGNIPDFSEMLSFQSARGHIRYAGENLTKNFYKLLDCSIDTIQLSLKDKINSVINNVVQWYNRAFDDTAELFSDEISTRNLYLLIESSINVYNCNYEYFGLNPLPITTEELQQLKEKLDTDYFIKGKTVVKQLNEYTDNELDEVIKHFSTEEYMTWKNKHTYIGDAPSPMVINFLESPLSDDHFVNYEDINTATGLSETEYLYIIKQLYDQFDVVFKKCKWLFKELESSEDENESLSEENTKLMNELNKLKSNHS